MVSLSFVTETPCSIERFSNYFLRLFFYFYYASLYDSIFYASVTAFSSNYFLIVSNFSNTFGSALVVFKEANEYYSSFDNFIEPIDL